MLTLNWPVFARIAAVIFRHDRFDRPRCSTNTRRPTSESPAIDKLSASDYSLYILRCADRSLYTGIAIDVDKRLQEHKNGVRGAKYLRGRAPFHLVFQQVTGDRSVASRLEYRVKQLDKIQKEALINGKLSLASLLKDRSNEVVQTSGGSCG